MLFFSVYRIHSSTTVIHVEKCFTYMELRRKLILLFLIIFKKFHQFLFSCVVVSMYGASIYEHEIMLVE